MKYPRLWAVCLALVPLTAACPASAQAPPQAPSPAAPALTGLITKISILGLKNIRLSAVQAKLTIKIGDAYTVDAMKKEVASLHGLGVFQTVSITSDPAHPNGVALTYTITENPVVQSIKFTANTPSGQPSVPAADLIAQMKTQTGQVLNTNILVKDIDTLFNHTTSYVYRQGFIFDVSSDINIDPKTGVLTIPLVEAYIKSIEISGNSRIKTADILAQMHTKSGDLCNEIILQNDLYAIYGTGEFKNIGPFQISSSERGKVSITIPVVEQAPATGSLDEKQGKVIPFLYDPLTCPFPVVQVSVNGQPPLPFIVDTGTSRALSLDFWAAKALGIAVSNPVQKNKDNITYQEVPIQGVALKGANRLNDFTFNTQRAVVLDLSVLTAAFPEQHIAGIIGLAALQPITSRFDFAAKTLTIFSAPHPPLHVSRGTLLPLNGNTDGNFLVQTTLAPNIHADLILDTGSDSTQVPLLALAVLHPTAASYDDFYIRLDAAYVCPALRLPKLDLGALSVPDVVVGTLPPPTRLSLGMDILAGYRMTLDGPNGQLILEPSAHSGRYVIGWSGLNITQDDQEWKVSEFRANSPARSAGLQIGDKIVTVDGIRVNELTEFQARRILGGVSGKPLQVSVKRGTGQGQSIFVSWTPLDEFSSPVASTDGLTLEKAPTGPWIVEQIQPGCPGDLAGLRVGDKITQVQGEEVAGMTISHYGDLVRQPVVVLGIAREGTAVPFPVRLTAPKH